MSTKSRAAERKERTTKQLAKMPYSIVVGVPMIPVEDMYPGCVVPPGQLMPMDVEVSKIVEAAELGMHDSQIAALVGLTKETLVNHFSKTIRAARAGRALELLKLLNAKAMAQGDPDKKVDFQSIEYLLGRQDPDPPKLPPGPVIVPLPQELFRMSPDELNNEIKRARAALPMAEVIDGGKE